MGYSGLGMVWYTVVYRGTNPRKDEETFVEFKVFFSMMKNRISDGADVPYFFRDLVAMITDVTEDEWDTQRPIVKADKRNTLRTYAKRDIANLPRASYKLSPEMFVDSLASRPSAV